MREVKQLAKNKIEAKCFAIALERGQLHGELAMGISAGVSVEEGYSVLDKLSEDLKVYEYILESINNNKNQ